jgi:hypothetical protein
MSSRGPHHDRRQFSVRPGRTRTTIVRAICSSRITPSLFVSVNIILLSTFFPNFVSVLITASVRTLVSIICGFALYVFTIEAKKGSGLPLPEACRLLNRDSNPRRLRDVQRRPKSAVASSRCYPLFGAHRCDVYYTHKPFMHGNTLPFLHSSFPFLSRLNRL